MSVPENYKITLKSILNVQKFEPQVYEMLKKTNQDAAKQMMDQLEGIEDSEFKEQILHYLKCWKNIQEQATYFKCAEEVSDVVDHYTNN